MRLLGRLIKQRPKYLLAVYVETDRIEVVRASRSWRTWQVDQPETHSPQENESVYDFLQRLNLKSRDRKSTALILFLPRLYYSFHTEQYPAGLNEQLEEALQFDWQENIFLDQDRTMNFFGPFVSVDRHLSVPIFSMQFEIYERFEQALSASEFQSFAVLPAAIAYKALSSEGGLPEEPRPIEIMGRVVDPAHLEINRFYNGQLLDSLLLGRNGNQLRLFREHLQCISEGTCQEPLHIHILAAPSERAVIERYLGHWEETDLPITIKSLETPLIETWVRHLLQLDSITSFTAPLILKPWEVPKVAWGILGVIVILALFSLYQVHQRSELMEESRRVKKETSYLEAQWKPIEQLQSRISKFQEDKKTLTEFNSEGYPLLELLSYLSQITPEDTWLNYVSVRKGQLILRGESKSAIRYLSELTKVEGFSDVRFASPVTRNPASDLERFNVQMQVDVDKLKKAFDSLPSEKDDKSAGEPLPEDQGPPPPPPGTSPPVKPGKAPPPPPPGTAPPKPAFAAPPMQAPAGEEEIDDSEASTETDDSGASTETDGSEEGTTEGAQ